MSTKQSNKDTPIKHHHWLIAAQMVFAQVDDQGVDVTEGAVLNINAIMVTEEKQIGVRELANAQTNAIANLNERFKGTKLRIIDVVILNLSHLGFMSREEYAANPAGQVLVKTDVPVGKPNLSVVKDTEAKASPATKLDDAGQPAAE